MDESRKALGKGGSSSGENTSSIASKKGNRWCLSNPMRKKITARKRSAKTPRCSRIT